MRPNQSIQVLRDVFDLQRRTLTRQGEELSSNDESTAREVIFQWHLLVVDTYHLDPVVEKDRLTSLMKEVLSTDLLLFLNNFSKCVTYVQFQKAGLKAQLSGIVPSLWRIIRHDVDSMLRGDVFAARRLYQIFSYSNRLTLVDIDLTEDQEREYLSNEESISDLWLPKTTVVALNNILKKWLCKWSLTSSQMHGPGGVAGHGRCSLETKYRDLSSDNLLEYSFPDPLKLDQPIFSHLSRISQTIFVPKSYKSFRTISMEPTTLMYHQQAVWRSIQDCVNRSYYLRSHIGFSDQSRNQDMARLGSIDQSESYLSPTLAHHVSRRRYSTIDLSAASDLVSWKLVKLLFRGTPLLRYLYSTRSTHTVLPSGKAIELKKFAPMGSALCFPIETLIFAAVCEFVTREHGFSSDYSVYGDDIVVPSATTADMFYVLQSLGFRVNTDKSFTDETVWFRESCGGDFVDGFEITPLRVSRTFASKSPNERYQADVDLANECSRRGLILLRKYFIDRCRLKNPSVLFGEESLHSPVPTNFHLVRRYNEFLQRTEVRCKLLRTSYSPREDDIALVHWLSSCEFRKTLPEIAFSARTSRSTVKLKSTWKGILVE